MTTNLTDSAAILRYHEDMIKLHGARGTAALGWTDDQSQLLRFNALVGIGDLNHHSVLDAGCGHGDLRVYLGGFYPDMQYHGIDQIPQLLKTARKRYGHLARTSFSQGDFLADALPPSDYIIACGSLNYRSPDPEFIFKAIRKLYEGSTLATGFNLLSRVAPNELIVAYNSRMIMEHCQSLSTHVILKDNYSDEDFTVFMYH